MPGYKGRYLFIDELIHESKAHCYHCSNRSSYPLLGDAMCGISGWYEPLLRTLDRAELERMVDRQFHRGPDNKGCYIDEAKGIALGHNRLSIIDLSEKACQPMQDLQTGCVISFNGEIYNYQALRRQLSDLGCQFNSQSDTEVLLFAMQKWGVDALNKLKGMFAFGFWDQQSEKLMIARDPMGVKPLYYRIDLSGKKLVFASEAATLLESSKDDRSLDRRALRQYLEFGYIYDSSRTIFSGIQKLPPGHYLSLSRNGSIVRQRYFEPALCPKKNATFEQLQDQLFDTLNNVVQEQLVADVPLGVLLSGGLDSSILAALASRKQKIKTFTFGFRHSDIDERNNAQSVSDAIGSEHQSFSIGPEEVMGSIQQNISCVDDLFADWGVFSTRLVYKKCRQLGIKVALVGEGADELFGGYWGRFAPGLENPRNFSLDKKLFLLYRRYVSRRYGRGFLAYRKIMRGYLEQTSGDLFSAIRQFECQNQLPNNFEMKVDKASMSQSVEARVPYLDSRVVELAYQIPGSMLIGRQGQTKQLLRAMALRHSLLPEKMAGQEKFGISLPPSWMDQSPDFQAFAKQWLLRNDSWSRYLGYGGLMKRLFVDGKQGSGFPSAFGIYRNFAWKLLMLEIWAQHFSIAPGCEQD